MERAACIGSRRDGQDKPAASLRKNEFRDTVGLKHFQGLLYPLTRITDRCLLCKMVWRSLRIVVSAYRPSTLSSGLFKDDICPFGATPP